jgi:tetratricopeptide (TPR) repeat protein
VKALEYFLKALELDPENPEYMLWAAKTYKTLGNDAEAELLLAVVKNYPGHWMEYWERLEKNA